MNETAYTETNRTAIVSTLAVIGFIALIGAGMWAAVYSTRYVPTVVNKFGAAAVYLGSVFTPSDSSLSVVPTPVATTTPPSNTASSTDSTGDPETPAGPKETVPTPGKKTTSTVPISGTGGSVVLSGLPDLVVTINAVGYLATSSADSFVAAPTVPAGSRPAVRFTIKNVGTNATGAWRFSASIPTQTAYVYESQPQQSLNPGDSIDYTLGFDQANRGVGQTIAIGANFDRAVAESNTNNNSASAQVTVLGS